MAGVPAYMRVRNYVIDLARLSTSPDVRIMTERELCKKFGLTRPTVRRAIKDLVDDGWINPMPGRGMFVNPQISINDNRKSVKRIVLVLNDGRPVDMDPFTMNAVARVCDIVRELDANLKIVTITLPPERLEEELSAYNPDGVLWLRPRDAFLPAIGKCRASFPIHTFGGVSDDSPCSTTMDYFKAGVLAAAWFLDKNLRDIAFIGMANLFQGVEIQGVFYSGWLSEFERRGCPYDKALSIDAKDSIKSALLALLATRRIEGVFSFGLFFEIVCAVLDEAGRADTCPVLIDENYFAFSKPPAARVMIFPSELIVKATRRLHENIISGKAPESALVLEPVIR